MSDLRPRGTPVMVNGRERRLLFTLNVIDTMQEKFGKPVNEVLEDMLEEGEAKPTLRAVMKILLDDEAEREAYKNKEADWETATDQEVGWLIGMDNWAEITALVLRAYGIDFPEPDEESDPNAMGGQQSS